jgi:HEAT repeat protein
VRLLRWRPPNVEKLERKGHITGLVEALAFEDVAKGSDGGMIDLGVKVRQDAAEALSRFESRAAFAGLLRALDDPEESVRLAAVRGLRNRGDRLAIDALTAIVTDGAHPERQRSRAEALEALASMGDADVPRRVAVGLLMRAEELDEEHDANAVRRLADAAGPDAMRATVEDLVGRLGEGNPSKRLRALLVALAPETVEPLIAALDDQAARRGAIFALGSTHDSRAVESLCTILRDDDDPPVRIAAAWALGEIRDPRAVEPLLVASGDGEFGVRSEAIQSFDKLGNAAIAVALGSLVRQALQNGAGPSHEALESVEGQPEEDQAEHRAQIPATPARDEVGSSAPRAESQERRPFQTELVLRRLLGRRRSS